jgi:hypothetical protein
MRKTIIGIIILLSGLHIARAQYISEVLEYVPAPGQHINAAPWGLPSSANTIIGGVNGSLSLGAFGGYVVFRFDEPVDNHPDNPFGIDFSIFGNPVEDASEPGVVYVMKDENGNGLPDDNWHVLAGSDHWFSKSHDQYEVTYYNPGEAADVPWADNLGGSGYIFTNAAHEQPYYPDADSFPVVSPNAYTLGGFSIKGAIDTASPVFVKSRQRAFGYADNRSRGNAPYTVPDNPYTPEKENAGGDAFDIAWAVDADGNYVDLDVIHFVKVQTAVMADLGWLGELSTEISGAADVSPDPGISGQTKMIVIRDLPSVIDTTHYQLEVFAFEMGRLQPDAGISWESSVAWASIDEDNMLNVTNSGELEVRARLASEPSVMATASCRVELPARVTELPLRNVHVYPNPASRGFRVSGIRELHLELYGADGRLMLDIDHYGENRWIDTGDIPPGLYMLKLGTGQDNRVIKLLIQ